MREDEGHALPLDAELGLEVAQDVAEVDVEELGGETGNEEDDDEEEEDDE